MGQADAFLHDRSGNLIEQGAAARAPAVVVPAQVLGARDGTAEISATVSGEGPFAFQWQRRTADGGGFVDVPGATRATLVLTGLATDQAADYRVDVASALGSVTSTTVRLDFDLDRDGMGDAWERATFGSTAPGAFADADGDGVTNLDEYREGTDALDARSHRPRLVIQAEHGAVEVDPPRVAYAPGEMVRVRSVAHPGYRFLGWFGDLEGVDPERGLVLDRSKVVGALFGPEGVHLGQALDQPDWPWQTTGALGWFAEPASEASDGNRARSGPITHQQESWLEVGVEPATPSLLRFDWGCSADAYRDYLEFWVDGQLRARATDAASATREFFLSPGRHFLRWGFRKDARDYLVRLLDYAWVDRVALLPLSEEDTDHDGLPDRWELERLGTLTQDGANDPDHDQTTNLDEWREGLDPLDAGSRRGSIMVVDQAFPGAVTVAPARSLYPIGEEVELWFEPPLGVQFDSWDIYRYEYSSYDSTWRWAIWGRGDTNPYRFVVDGAMQVIPRCGVSRPAWSTALGVPHLVWTGPSYPGSGSPIWEVCDCGPGGVPALRGQIPAWLETTIVTTKPSVLRYQWASQTFDSAIFTETVDGVDSYGATVGSGDYGRFYRRAKFLEPGPHRVRLAFTAWDPRSAGSTVLLALVQLEEFDDPNLDSDQDGLADPWEYRYLSTLVWNGQEDPDGDGVTNALEQTDGTNPADKTSFAPRLRLSALNGTLRAEPDRAAYSRGETVVVTATPADGWAFLGWDGSEHDATNPKPVVLDGHRELAGRFGQPDAALAAAIEQTGEVWASAGSRPWTVSADVDAVGGSAASLTGWVGVDPTRLEGVVTVATPSLLHLRHKVHAAGNCFGLAAVIDGTTRWLVSGSARHEDAWEETVIPLATGVHNVRVELSVWAFSCLGQPELIRVAIDAVRAEPLTDDRVDTDADGLSDRWELATLGTLGFGRKSDPDGDGSPNDEEAATGTDPRNPASFTPHLQLVADPGRIVATPAPPYAFGQHVRIEYIPEGDAVFLGWKGDLTGEANPGEIVMDGPRRVEAVLGEVLPDLSDALNTPERAWYRPSRSSDFTDTGWEWTEATTHDGVAAASASPFWLGTASMETVLEGPGTLTFWWRTTALAPGSELSLLLEGRVLARLSGDTDWQPVTVTVPAGRQRALWRFRNGDDRVPLYARNEAFVDEVRFLSRALPPVTGADAIATFRGQALIVRANQLLANDVDSDGGLLRIVGLASTRSAMGGSLVWSGEFATYTPPAAGFVGTDRFVYLVEDANRLRATGDVVVTVLPEPARFAIASIEPQNGGVNLRILADPGATISIERSVDLTNWERVGVATPGGSPGEFVWSEVPGGEAGWRFYRAVR